MSSVLERSEVVARRSRSAGSRLLLIGALTFAATLAGWLVYACTHGPYATVDPADLQVYKNGGLIIRHVAPTYDPSFSYPLYDWPRSVIALKFTYTPFAAIFFAAISYVPWSVLPRLSQGANVAFLLGAAWFTAGLLGCRSWRGRLGGALLGAAAGLVTEPVFRTLYLGQVNLLLMAAILGDLSLSDNRRFKGLVTGLAAGIKLVPLVFIPYLLLTRRFRAAGLAAAGFAATVVLGWAVVPGDSGAWWLHGLFFSDGRTGFVGWGGNQSLRGLLTRLMGSINAAGPAWVIAVALTAVIGLACAVLLDRAGHTMLAILATALVGLLDSPISWDHHWVWVIPAIMAAAWYGARAWEASRSPFPGRPFPGKAYPGEPFPGKAYPGEPFPGKAYPGEPGAPGKRWAACWCGLLGVVLLALFAPWPGSLWSVPVTGPGDFTDGIIWAGPNSKVSTYTLFGDNPAYKEYHWAGLQNLSGNAYVLAGLALLILLAAVALRTRRAGAAPPA